MGEKVRTGITGLDSMLYGGIPEKNQILLLGAPGAGKTLLGFEYLYRNAKLDNSCLFFALEEDAKRVVANAKSTFLDWKDFDQIINSGRLHVDGEDPSTALRLNSADSEKGIKEVIDDIEKIVTEKQATRVVIDSISLLELVVKDPVVYRKSLLTLVGSLRNLGATSILIGEMPTPERVKLQFKPEYFIFDGIVAMYQTGEEAKRIRSIEVVKMRGSKHSIVTTPYDISPLGFKVFSTEDISQY